ncbi:MAG: LPS export ABC transporter periplasmic protein LptC [Deltaproteobacteria bacterium HGW-Deltaproteobacteria-6]|jgi:LPS export ABC transporter protein LptC|nr:MAG: LPS export ABC transporter periplasmic protein LptC [Deltaproteobacteria bacterium HGW-Deltaproteobacteria-6]
MRVNKKVKIIAAALIIMVLAALVIFAVVRGTGEKKTNVIKILPDQADVSIQDFVYTEVGKNNIQWEVKAKTAQYKKKQKLALFDQVQIKLTTQKGKVYIMTGDKGEMLTDKKDVEIKGHVVITSDTGEKVLTDYLHYGDVQKIIHTDAPVVMESKRMKIQGVGMSIFINKGHLTLLSRVRAEIR